MDLPQAVLEWDRGALEVECERAAGVQAGVETYLGRSVFSSEGELVVRVALARLEDAGGSRVVANVTQRDASGKVWGERTVTGDSSCASLDEPLTLVVALLVDAPLPVPEAPPPEALAPEPVRRTAPEPEHAPASDETSEIQTAPSLARLESAPRPAHAAFLVLGAASMGVLPGAGGGARALVSVKPRGFVGLGGDVIALVPQRKALGGGSLDLSFIALSGSVCPLQGVDGSIWYSACASLGAARLHAESHDLLEARSRAQWLALPGIGVRAAWIAGAGLMLAGGIDAAFPLSADRYVYRDAQGRKLPAHELGSLAITASLGVGLLVK